ncbi:APC family permease [Alicyclobacillus tolerans]|uniref:Amino acid transporter n=1 Tax=Alicyclobacillus tolerans TaxID=90970 RepID=A0ABT9LXQ2_9BACL|nr:APC family permease [Alicyclobacillus tengchongensis]MDP9729040.1 amino acid transporter [Alicyclobacillus tengchongensis]
MHKTLPFLDPLLIVLSLLALWFAVANFNSVKRFLVGRPMRSRELNNNHTKLFWFIALPVLAADLYSSVAYGPEAGITEIAQLGVNVKWLIVPITLATVILLTALIISYIMGVSAYPNGGGAYAIAKDNFRAPWVRLLASSSLMIDYILTVAVSISSGIQQIASAYPILAPHVVGLSIACIIIILLVNLRGVSESASVFAWPTLFFMLCMVFLIGYGFIEGGPHGLVSKYTPPFGVFPKGLTLLLLLKAFSSACSSLTGIETISNSVPIFREPRTRGAIKAYIALGTITGITLIGFSSLLYFQGISVNPNNTMLSQLLGSYFGHSILYQIIIWATFLVLILAANSTFTGFPQLTALMAGDGFLPRSLLVRGDRLGYSNGMLVLAALSALLIEGFRAQTNSLIPLYAIGVFVAFTVAQIGLVKRWLRVRGKMWRLKSFINSFGAVLSAVVAIVFAVTKFTGGAWIVLVVLPLLMFMATKIRKHYTLLADELRINLKEERPIRHHVVTILLLSGLHRVTLNSLSFALSLNSDVIAVYVGFDDESIARIEKRWEEWGNPCRLVTLKSEYRSLIQPVQRFIKFVESREGGRPDHIHIILSQFLPKRHWAQILHNQSSLLLRTWFLWNKDVIITTVPYHLNESEIESEKT